MRTEERSRNDRWVAAALIPTIAGGLVLSVTWLVDVPTTVGALSFLAFAGGCVIAGSAAYLDARRSGGSFGASLWRGLKMFLGWLAAFFP